MISTVEASPSFAGKAIVKVNITKLEEFKRNLAQVGRNMGKKTQFNRLMNENTKIPQDVLVVSGTTSVAKRGTNIGFIVEDNGDDTTLLNALKKVFGDDKVQSWKEFTQKQKSGKVKK